MDVDRKIFNEYLFLLFNSKMDFDSLNSHECFSQFEHKNPVIILKHDPSVLFDVTWYQEKYEIPKNINPLIHYLEIGFKKGYNPNCSFDTAFYLDEYPDVKKDGVNPFIHYLKYGIYEGRIPKLFTLDEIKKQILRVSLKGRSKYLFLFNDSNNEILQHYDGEYVSTFDSKSFIDQYNYKKNVFNSNGIDYSYYVVPDKSIVCKDFLPFKVTTKKRTVDAVPDIIDFSSYLEPEDYFKNDSHMNYQGGKKLAFKILNHIDSSLDCETFKNIISNYSIPGRRLHNYDLLSQSNWSYSFPEKLTFTASNIEIYPRPSSLICLHDLIPKKFNSVRDRKSEHFKNKKAFSNLKVLIFHDSSIRYLKWYFSFYFKEMFLFWDHGNMDKELIEWYKPDLILEVRIERFIEKLPVPYWILNGESLNMD